MRIKRFEGSDYRRLMEIWENTVLLTHDFLEHEDFLFFKDAIPNEYLPNLDIYVIEDDSIRGFMAVDSLYLQMLFIDGLDRGKGYGKALLEFAVQKLGIKEVDVNEQNPQAIGFYLKNGFKVIDRSPKDSLGKDYPILHLSL